MKEDTKRKKWGLIRSDGLGFSTNAASRSILECWNFEGFHCVPVPSDGNCMFAAIADQLHVSGIDSVQRTAMDVRLELVNFIRSHSSLSSQIQANLEDTDTLENYLDRMSKNGNWGDGNMLSAASMCHKRRLEILQTNGSQRIIIDSPAVSSAESLFLGYVSSLTAGPQNHYISLRRDVHIKDNDHIQQKTSKSRKSSLVVVLSPKLPRM